MALWCCLMRSRGRMPVRSAFARRGAGEPAMLPATVSEMNLRHEEKEDEE